MNSRRGSAPESTRAGSDPSLVNVVASAVRPGCAAAAAALTSSGVWRPGSWAPRATKALGRPSGPTEPSTMKASRHAGRCASWQRIDRGSFQWPMMVTSGGTCWPAESIPWAAGGQATPPLYRSARYGPAGSVPVVRFPARVTSRSGCAIRPANGQSHSRPSMAPRYGPHAFMPSPYQPWTTIEPAAAGCAWCHASAAGTVSTGWPTAELRVELGATGEASPDGIGVGVEPQPATSSASATSGSAGVRRREAHARRAAGPERRRPRERGVPRRALRASARSDARRPFHPMCATTPCAARPRKRGRYAHTLPRPPGDAR